MPDRPCSMFRVYLYGWRPQRRTWWRTRLALALMGCAFKLEPEYIKLEKCLAAGRPLEMEPLDVDLRDLCHEVLDRWQQAAADDRTWPERHKYEQRLENLLHAARGG